MTFRTQELHSRPRRTAMPLFTDTFNMALPVTETVADCADLARTVLPYVSQLYDLPQQILQSYNDPAEVQKIYLSTNPLVTAFAFSLFVSPIFLLISEINRNYSQVDRLWSILPTIYNAHYVLYAHLTGLPTQRLDNLLAVSVVWSVSITTKVFDNTANEIPAEINLQLLAKRGLFHWI